MAECRQTGALLEDLESYLHFLTMPWLTVSFSVSVSVSGSVRVRLRLNFLIGRL